MHHVAVLALPPVTAFDLAIPGLILGNARVDGAPGYEVKLCTPRPGTVASADAAQGLDLVIRQGLGILRQADTIIVVGSGSREPLDPVVIRALQRAHKACRRMVSLCTGAFALAQAGLLEGRGATTFWLRADELRSRFPAIEVRPDVLFVEDGSIVTSAGVAAGIDLCLHLVMRDYGAAVANEVARMTVVAPVRAGGQAQFIPRPASQQRGDSLAPLREWACRHLDRPISLAELARRAHLSERTLTRKFRAETGTSPLQWLLQQRLGRARELLETTALPMERIAESCGLGSADSLRQHFAGRIGIAPAAYRAAFGHARANL
ncbi:GlxA family transcriptional regulator [Pseudoxanthomonas wuyuanensis]|uniref:Transcriptional regulator, AraC family with amidase-like domain n=1 Tax=Pseudoxanthomonas wuyuanensis TaxID=1073196 RepID=A0A286CWP8_9GAMM|nr:helix-turn-helix domain-containing protein [Pseudoxanthomonas wuyuanensis]KAF1720901.1 AraC family transcriptional regulator [Pseudoxanthomonas wuyuanensis]SOD50840.1 transcriptional regulator, AraC family with amidase-like domain [Pseudoxanthomonas wuyuanensis]